MNNLPKRSYFHASQGLSFPNAFPPKADQPQAEVGNPRQIHSGTSPDEAISGPPTETFGGDSSGKTILLKQKILTRATQTLGFDDCRFTDPFVSDHLQEQKDWLKAGFHGDMKYLEDHVVFKKNPELLLKGVKSAIVLIKNYKNISARRISGEFKIARYAVGRDYHLVMQKKMKQLIDFLQVECPGIECYSGVDSRPLPERSLALKAGIGFRGKNTMVIKPGLGSYFFIGVILTNHSFENDSPLNWNCGQCRLCLDACPTGALVPNQIFSNETAMVGGGTSALASVSLDATKCISYLTIEKKESLTSEELKKTNGWIFGCDICQEVCPYNHGQTPLTDWKEFLPEAGVGFDFFKNLSFPNALIGNPDEISGPPIKTFGGDSFGNFASKLSENDIPKDTPLYRSRKRIVPNLQAAKSVSLRAERSEAKQSFQHPKDCFVVEKHSSQ